MQKLRDSNLLVRKTKPWRPWDMMRFTSVHTAGKKLKQIKKVGPCILVQCPFTTLDHHHWFTSDYLPIWCQDISAQSGECVPLSFFKGHIAWWKSLVVCIMTQTLHACSLFCNKDFRTRPSSQSCPCRAVHRCVPSLFPVDFKGQGFSLNISEREL